MLGEVKNNSSDDNDSSSPSALGSNEQHTSAQTPHVTNAPCDCFECFLETTCEELN